MALGNHLYDYVLDKLDTLPGNYLEIGVFNGDGFARVAKKFTNKVCYALDPFIEDGHTSGSSGLSKGESLIGPKEKFLEHTKDLDNIVLFEETSVDFYSRLSNSLIQDMNISMITIDGSHHYNDVVNDIELSVKLLSNLNKGIIVFDDLHVNDVARAYQEFLQQHKKIIKEHGLFSNCANFTIIEL